MALATDGTLDDITGHDDPVVQLTSILSNKPHDFLESSTALQDLTIRAAKAVLDPVANSVQQAQAERRRGNSRKRKRAGDGDEEHILQLKQIYTIGLGTKQVWEQARRVLDAACYEVEKTLEGREHKQKRQNAETFQLGDPSIEDDRIDLSDEPSDELELVEDEDELVNDSDENLDGLTDAEDIEADSDIQPSSDEDDPSSNAKTFVPDPNGLNDGFFSIDDFNKQTQFLEQMDARGDDDNPSDEDEVDWDADPLSMSISGLQSRRKQSERDEDNDDQNEEDDDDEGDGPAFGNMPLNGVDSDDDENNDQAMDEDQGLDGGFTLSNANDIRYTDFFEPPPKKPSKPKRMRALPKTQPPNPVRDQPDVQGDIERAMADVRRDLLDSEDEDDLDDDQDESGSDVPARSNATNKNLSSHEKQRATIAAEIRRLEAANVAKRDWQLSGEARAADRPVNSLLEEDLEFERAGKPVPVVTAETSEEIEQLIKRRILAREFDEVIRRSAAGIGSASDTRRGRIELDDSKPQASLGELYEQDHLKANDPASYIDKRTAATKKQHDQIDTLWKEVNEQLNLLSNLHFKPKRVDVEMKVVEDKPRIAMEDARPVGELESGEGGMLAPQEVYRPGIDTSTNDTRIRTSKSGASQNTEELTREEKLRRRRREKERTKKSQSNKAQIVLGRTAGKPAANGSTPRQKRNKEQEKSDIISDLKKGNVKIVGKDGELQNLTNKKKARGDSSQVIAAGNLKL